MASTDIYRIDHHGSLVRPSSLVDAAELAVGGDELSEREDAAIRDVVRMQRQLLLTTVTDGHFRRADFRDPVLRGVSGFTATGGFEPNGLREWRSTGAVESLAHLVVAEVAAPMAATGIPVKATLPSPAYIAEHTWSVDSGGPYGSAVELGTALAAVVRDQLAALIAAGVPYIQLDNPDYARHYVEDAADEPRPQLGVLDAIAVDAAAVDGLDRDGATVAIAVDWGHQESDAVDEQIAWEVFAELPYDRFLIPYCSDNFVEANLLQFLPDDREVVLGIVDAGSAELEDVDRILARVDRALGIVDSAHVSVSPQRGFHNVSYRAPRVTVEEQGRLLTHVETVARMVWGAEL